MLCNFSHTFANRTGPWTTPPTHHGNLIMIKVLSFSPSLYLFFFFSFFSLLKYFIGNPEAHITALWVRQTHWCLYGMTMPWGLPECPCLLPHLPPPLPQTTSASCPQNVLLQLGCSNQAPNKVNALYLAAVTSKSHAIWGICPISSFACFLQILDLCGIPILLPLKVPYFGSVIASLCCFFFGYSFEPRWFWEF